MGMKRASTTETVQDLWTTDAFNDAALGVWLRTEPPSTGIEGLDKADPVVDGPGQGPAAQERGGLDHDGSEGQARDDDPHGDRRDPARETSVPASTFEIPSGYTEQQMEMEGQGEKEDDGNPFSRFLKGRDKGNGGGER